MVFTPADNYHITEVKVNDVTVEDLKTAEDGTYTYEAQEHVTGNISVVVTTKQDPVPEVKLGYSLVTHYRDISGTDAHTDTKEDTADSGTSISELLPEGYEAAKTHENKSYVFDSVKIGDDDTAEATLTEDGTVIHLYYDIDELGGTEENPGDNIPDKNQIVFTYVADENGSFGKDASGNTIKTTTELLTKDADGSAKPSAVPTPVGDSGYAFDYWQTGESQDQTEAMTTLKTQSYQEDTTFTANWKLQSFTTTVTADTGVTVVTSLNDQNQITYPWSETNQAVSFTLKDGYTLSSVTVDTVSVTPTVEDHTYTVSVSSKADHQVVIYTTAPLNYSVVAHYRSKNGGAAGKETLSTGTAASGTDLSSLLPTNYDSKRTYLEKTYLYDSSAKSVTVGENTVTGATLTQDGTVIHLYYDIDELGGTEGSPGDNIPDKNQIVFT
jgi:hypothetical protein